jgi:hypothetical protein
LHRNLADIADVKDERLYGVFPFFRQYVTIEQLVEIAAELSDVQADFWEGFIASVPAAWQVSAEAKRALSRFLLERARFLADNIEAVASRVLAAEFDE